MKNYKFFSIVAALVMGLSLSSCLKDDNNDSDIEKKWEDWVKDVNTEIKSSIGTYEGYLYYLSDASTAQEVKQDSIRAVWGVSNDSTMEMSSVPTALLVKQLPEGMKALQTAISERSSVNILVNMMYDYQYCSPLLIYVYPQPVKFPIIMDGKEHQVEINFYNSGTSNNSYARYMMKDGNTYVNKSLIYLFPKSVIMDGQTQYTFMTTDCYLTWYGSKK